MERHHQHRSGQKRRLPYVVLLTVFAVAAGCAGYFILFHTHAKTADLPHEKVVAVSSKPTAASKGRGTVSSKPTASSEGRPQSQQAVISVSHINQEDLLPAGCELASAMMLLDYYGQSTTADEIIKRTPKSSLLSDGSAVYGMSPSQAFIGDPRSQDGLGCYAPVVTAVIDSYFWDGGKKEAVNATGTDLDTLAKDYIAKGSPVLVWATVDMKEPGKGRSWTLADTNKNFQWIAGEHCLLMVGYDSQKYYFNDPLDSSGTVSYSKTLVKDRYGALGKQAVTVRSVSH